MKVAIAQIRRAASTIKARQERVTYASLAHELNKPCGKLARFIKGVNGIADELQIRSSKRHRKSKYLLAARMLLDAGLIISARRIAILSNSQIRAVTNWILRNKEIMNGFCIVSEKAHKKHLLEVRLRRLACTVERDCRGAIIVSRLAAAAGLDRTHLHRILKQDPDLRKSVETVGRISVLTTCKSLE